MKTIGIIGGMGPLATADLYEKITLNTLAACDQEHIHIIIDSNSAIPDRTQFILWGGEDPMPEMTASIRRLEAAGADLLIMPCNTAHYFYSQLSEMASVPLLDMLGITMRELSDKYSPGSTIGLLATDGTVRSGIYHRALEQAGFRPLLPKQYQRQVMGFIYDGMKRNNLSIDPRGLAAAISELQEQNARAIVLGCTELSAAVKVFPFPADTVDPLLLLAKESIRRAGGKTIDDGAR